MSTNTSVHPDSERLAAYVDKEASIDEKDAIERHLAECAACREVVTGTRDFLAQEERAFSAFVLAAVLFAVLAWAGWYIVKNAESYHAPMQQSGTAR